MDKARVKTDKILNDIEGAISTLFANSKQIHSAGMRYRRYMKWVDMRTRSARERWLNEKDIKLKAEYQKAYRSEIESYTTGSYEYQRIIAAFSLALAEAGQGALDIVNEAIPEIYVLNYNAVAPECEKAGMEVKDGKTENMA